MKGRRYEALITWPPGPGQIGPQQDRIKVTARSLKEAKRALQREADRRAGTEGGGLVRDLRAAPDFGGE